MTAAAEKTVQRIRILDVLRGGAMILVVAYHVLYDLKYIYGKNIPRLITPGQPETEMVHIIFLWVLFVVSGICSGYSKNSLKRGAALYLLGFGITLATAIFMPGESIVFGVISCFGACMVITYFLMPLLGRIPWQLRTMLFILLWAITRNFYRGGELDLFVTQVTVPLPESEYLYPIGIKGKYFYSADYFPLIPYMFMYLTGNSLYEPVSEGKCPKLFYNAHCKPLELIGRHTLLIYIVHQPLLLVIMELIFR